MERQTQEKTAEPGSIAEYNTLRTEILKRIEIRNSIVFGTLTFASALMGFGLTIPSLAIIYVIISMFLAAAWVQSDLLVSDIGCYIRENFEIPGSGLYWETYRQECREQNVKDRTLKPGMAFSSGGVFIVTQIIALAVAFSQLDIFTLLDWGLSIVALLCMFLTIYFFAMAARRNVLQK